MNTAKNFPQNGTKIETWSVDELLKLLQLFGASEAWNAPIPTPTNKTDTSERILESFAALKALHALLEKRLDEIKGYLHEASQVLGREVEKGWTWSGSTGTTCFRERRQSAEPEAEALRNLLKERGLDPTTCFDIEPRAVLNMSKLQLLVDLGKLDGAEVEALKPVGFAIRTTPSPKLKKQLESALKGKKKRTKK